MTLGREDQDIAETLLRQYKAQKQVNCCRRMLCRTAESLELLGKAITSELEGKPDRLMAKRKQAQMFSVEPATQIAGTANDYELPNADNLASLLEAYRTACQTLESSTKQVAEL